MKRKEGGSHGKNTSHHNNNNADQSIITIPLQINRSPEASGSFLEGTLDAELRLAELISGGVLDLQLLESTSELGLNRGLGTTLELQGELGAGDGVLDLVDVCLQVRLRLMASREVLVGLLELLSILDHLLDLSGRETANGVGDRDLSLAAGSTVLGGDLQETVGIDLEGGHELRLATGHGRNAVELELAQKTVVAALSALTLVPVI